jgi:hypothetical protein
VERDEALTDLHDHLASMIDRNDGPQAGVCEPRRPRPDTPLTLLAAAYIADRDSAFVGDKIFEGRRMIEAYTEQAIRDMVRHAAGHTTDGKLFTLFAEDDLADLR